MTAIIFRKSVMTWIVALAAIFLTRAVASAQAPAPRPAPPAQEAPAKVPSTRTTSPTELEINEALGKRLVWVNPTTKVFHKDGVFYGKTRSGRFMTEGEAKQNYYRPSPDAAKLGSAEQRAEPDRSESMSQAATAANSSVSATTASQTQSGIEAAGNPSNT